MKFPRNEDAITFDDIETLRGYLDRLAFEYRSLVRCSIEQFFDRELTRRHEINLEGTSIDFMKLFRGENILSFHTPGPLRLGDLTITFQKGLPGANFLSCGNSIPVADSPGMVEVDLKNVVDLRPGQEIPTGHVLLNTITLDNSAFDQWLEIFGALIEYYLAAVEPLIRHRIIAPTLDGRNSMLLLTYGRVIGLVDGDKKRCRQRILEDYEALYWDFEIVLAELRRESYRRLTPEEEFSVATNKITRPQYTTIFPEPRQRLVKCRKRQAIRVSNPWRIREANRQAA